jgi:iron complex outermembrane receptor protein
MKGTEHVKKTTLTALKAGAAPLVLSLAFVSSAAFAQAADVDCTANPNDAACVDDGATIVVTGSILRRTDTETPSPVTTLSTETLEARGVNTVAEGLQRIAANGSGTLSEGWNNGNNFAAGANAVSLRGLTVQKTLTVFDGLRMAPYPIADDGHRNFVDLSTVPDVVVQKVEVLKDGASSTYGADAVAGVINVIMKKEIQGLHLNVTSGISGHGDGGEQRIDASYGYGDLEEQGFNIYVAGSYRNNDVIWARDREFPFNSGDLSSICDGGTPNRCMAIGTRWYQFGVNTDGTLGGSSISNAPMVAPGTLTGGRTGVYRLLNPDCGAFGSQAAVLPASAATTVYNSNVCSMDMRKAYATIRPSTERYAFVARATAKIGDNAEAYISANYMHVNTYSQLTPQAFNNQTTAPQTFLLNPIVLPVYVCGAGVATINAATGVNTSSGCSAANGTLNPNNPFAAAGQVALIRGRYDRPQTVETNARSLRGAAGIQGTFGSENDWNYQLDFTASEVKLTRVSENYMIPQRLADVIATGAYNFVQPWANTQAVRDYVAPVSSKTSTSELWQVQAILGRTLFQLPGGPLQAAVGVSYRHESINDPSANPENLAHPYDRYFGINAVGAVGSRNVKSGFFEIGAPVIEQLELNVSGRYDDYSSGQTNFSPKVGVKFQPISQLVLRGTWSKGFRIPSFNEAYGLPTTGYTTTSVNCTTYAAFCAAHGNNTYATGQYSLGRTSIGNAKLAPEKSTSWTLGAVVEPIRGLSFTVDYFNIKVRNVVANISAAEQTAALDAYLKTGNTTAVPGVSLIPATADPAFPGALALPGFLQFSFQNADTEEVQGIDFGVDWTHEFGNVRLNTNLDATYLLKYQVTRKDGSVERYDGSLSPCDYTSCSGSPKWRGTWSNTLTIGAVSLNATAYYTAGYDLASVDYGGVPGDCAASVGASVVTYKSGGPVACRAKATYNVDLSMQIKVNDRLTIYGNVLNALGIKAPFDPSAAYSITQYNPAWAQANVVGRYFRIGAKVDF